MPCLTRPAGTQPTDSPVFYLSLV